MFKTFRMLLITATSLLAVSALRAVPPSDVLSSDLVYMEEFDETSPQLPAGFILIGLRGQSPVIVQLGFDADHVRGECLSPGDESPIPFTGTRRRAAETMQASDIPSPMKSANRWDVVFDKDTRTLTGHWTPDKGAPQIVALHPVAERVLLTAQQAGAYAANASYIRFTNARKAQTTINDAERRLATLGLMEFTKDCPDTSDIGPAPWTYDSRFSATLISDDLISLVQTTYSYAGGAHGDFECAGRTYWIQGDAARLLRFSDILKTDAHHWARFEALVARQLVQSDPQIGWKHFDKSTLPAQTDFSLAPTGIGIHFSQGTIAAECEGAITVIVPYSDLKDIALEKSPIRRYLPSPPHPAPKAK